MLEIAVGVIMNQILEILGKLSTSFRHTLLGALFFAASVFVLLLLAGVSVANFAYTGESTIDMALMLGSSAVLMILGSVFIYAGLKDDNDGGANQRPDEELDEADYDRVYSLSESVEFFDTVSPFYDERTSVKREQSNDLIHSFCQNHFRSLHGLRLADLGGGTGRLLQKFRHHAIEWTNIDNSRKALDIFDSRFERMTNVSSRHFDICSGSFQLDDETFDILILNFVLSTVAGPFPFKNIVNMMHAESLFVLADNHGAYAQGRLYDFNDVRGKCYALRVKPIDPDVLETEAENAGLRRLEKHYVYTNDDKVYSQVLSFQLAQRNL